MNSEIDARVHYIRIYCLKFIRIRETYWPTIDGKSRLRSPGVGCNGSSWGFQDGKSFLELEIRHDGTFAGSEFLHLVGKVVAREQ